MSHGARASREAPRNRRATDQKTSCSASSGPASPRSASRSLSPRSVSPRPASSCPVSSASLSTGIGYQQLPLQPHSEVASAMSASSAAPSLGQRIPSDNTESSHFLESPQLLESASAGRDTSRVGRGRGSRTVTPAERAQAREVSLRRIGALFAPYRWQLAIVTVVIVA